MVFRKLASLLGHAEAAPKPSIRFAAFGKHPGWYDHMEELGLDTDRLIALRRMLYSEGVNRNIDSGSWQQLEPGQTIERFRHVFVWKTGPDLVIGRLWSSTDGRGRSLYPMVLAAQCTGVPLKSALRLTMSRFEVLEAQLLATTEADRVRQLITAAKDELTQEVGAAAPAAPATADRPPLAVLADCEDLGPDAEGLYRVLYQIDTDMGDMRRKKVDSRSGTVQVSRAHHLRVPRCATNHVEALLLWHDFLAECFSAGIPSLTLLPLEHNWVDIILGEPTAAHIFCLKASPEKIPLASAIPYSIPDDFRQRLREQIEQARQVAAT